MTYQNYNGTYTYKGYDGFSCEITQLAYHTTQKTNTPLFGQLEAFRHKNSRQLDREPQMFMTALMDILKKHWITTPEIQFHEIAYSLIELWKNH